VDLPKSWNVLLAIAIFCDLRLASAPFIVVRTLLKDASAASWNRYDRVTSQTASEMWVKGGASSLAVARGSGCLPVEAALSELRQQLVGLLLLLQRLVEQPHGLRQVQLAGPGLQGAVAGNLVVLDGLST